MSRVNGQLVTCGRCGTTCFVRTTGDEEKDGGFTRWNKFEPMPEGWATEVIGGRCLDLCPKCNEKWRGIMATFLQREQQFITRQDEKEADDCGGNL